MTILDQRLIMASKPRRHRYTMTEKSSFITSKENLADKSQILCGNDCTLTQRVEYDNNGNILFAIKILLVPGKFVGKYDAPRC